MLRSIELLVILTICTSTINSHANVYDLNPPPFPCSEYEMLIVNTKQCVSRCPIVCDNLRGCYEKSECPCDGAYMTSFADGLICAADCLPGCKQAGGYCAAPNLCVCRKGYTFDALKMRCRKQRHRLLNRCIGRCTYGRCSNNGECICAEGYVLRSAPLFGQLCTPVCQVDCGPGGYCYMPNMCACRSRHHHYGRDGKCHRDFSEVF